MSKSIQMIRLESGSYMALHEVMFNSPTSGKIRFCANPIILRREESFTIENNMVVLESFYFPIQYLIQWLHANDAIDEETNLVKNIGYEDILS